MLSGTRDTNGNCGRGESFTWKGKPYEYHARLASAHGSVKELVYEVDGATSMILIDGIGKKLILTKFNNQQNI